MKMKFKVGDYVEVADCIPLTISVGQIVDIEDDGYIIDDCLVQEKYIKLWKPKKGELCVFFDSYTPMFIAEFKHIQSNLYYGVDSLGTLKYAHNCKPLYSNLNFVKDVFNG